jgi:hypothetical protein
MRSGFHIRFWIRMSYLNLLLFNFVHSTYYSNLQLKMNQYLNLNHLNMVSFIMRLIHVMEKMVIQDKELIQLNRFITINYWFIIIVIIIIMKKDIKQLAIHCYSIHELEFQVFELVVEQEIH